MRPATAIYLILVCSVVLYSCSRRPGYVLPESKMTDVLYDIQLAQAVTNSYIDPQYNNVESKDALLKSVLEKYKISQADFDTSLVWYSDNMDIYMKINDTIASRMRAKAEILRTVISKQNEKENALRNRLLPKNFYLTGEEPTLSFNVDSFKIKSMDMKHFKLAFDVQGLSSVDKVSAGLYFTYRDTSIQKIVNVDENLHYVIDKPQMPDSLLKGVSGYIHLRHGSLPGRVLLYNIQYQDSTSHTTDTLNTSPRRPDGTRRERRLPPLVEDSIGAVKKVN